MSARVASGRLSLAVLALSFSALALAPAGTACAQWQEAYENDWLGPMPHKEGYGEHVWGQVDYLVWQLSDTYLPPLITSSPLGTNPADAGVLDEPATLVLAGNQQVGDHWRSGVSMRGGMWLDPWQMFGVTGDFFNAGEDDFKYNTGPSGSFFLARPFFDTNGNQQNALPVNSPGQLLGAAHVRASDEFDGAGIGFQQCLYQGCEMGGRGLRFRLDVTAGYRFYEYASRLAVSHEGIITSGVGAGDEFLIDDEFKSRSEFHGGEVALDGRLRQGRWWIDGLFKLAVGDNRRSVTVDGRTVFAPSGGSVTVDAGGLLAAEISNMGRYADSDVAAIPDLRLGVGCQLTPRLSARLGYRVIIWDGVVQAASHLPPFLAVDDRNLPSQGIVAGGGPAPVFPGLQDKTLVAHGFDLGLELAY
jgi:hypothetical protein